MLEQSSITAKFDGTIEFEELRTVKGEDNEGNAVEIVIGRTAEMRLIDDQTGISLATNNVPYGSYLRVTDKKKVKKGDVICEWDPYNAVIISESAGTIKFADIEKGVTYREEIDEQTGFMEKVISETRSRKLIPTIAIVDSKGKELKHYTLPVGAHIIVEEGDKIKSGTDTG